MSNQDSWNALFTDLVKRYQAYAPLSYAAQQTAREHMVDGVSHSVRMLEPFPPRIRAARGAFVTDLDSHTLLDFWQGNMANILGHNPPVIIRPLTEAFNQGAGLLTGYNDETEIAVAELICRQIKQPKIRFTTSGTLATMYALILACAYSRRDTIVKVIGGWHGAHPWGMIGADVSPHVRPGMPQPREALPYHGIDLAAEKVILTHFNDPQSLEDVFMRFSDRIAGVIIEPFIGSGGMIFATPEYLQTARRLTERHGALLILDEVISGFRFGARDLGSSYGITPDLSVFGKVIGGSMPLAGVAGREDVMALAGKGASHPVRFTGGTYSSHAGTMIAARAMLEYLVANEATIYPALAEKGLRIRQIVEESFAAEGIHAACTGANRPGLPGSSFLMVNFPLKDGIPLERPDEVLSPTCCDQTLRGQILPLALLLEDVCMISGRGATNTSLGEADLEKFTAACQNVARIVHQYQI